jgi:hypothetical protein
MPASGTSSTSGFIGRERELAELRAGLADVTAGHGHLFLLSGERGFRQAGLAWNIRQNFTPSGYISPNTW